MKSKLYEFLNRTLFVLRENNLNLKYNPADLNNNFYLQVKKSGDKELEHQIGRLTNFKKIIQEIKNNNLRGDFIEFGTWQGFSLLWTAYFLERQGMFDRKLFAFDSFSGLPYSDGSFTVGEFKDTSLLRVRNNINRSELYDKTKENIYIHQNLYSQKKQIIHKIKKNSSSKFCFVHIDCDVSKSVTEVFSILNTSLLASTCYVLFDDFGMKTNLANTATSIFAKMSRDWRIKVHSQTLLTKNFKLTLKK